MIMNKTMLVTLSNDGNKWTRGFKIFGKRRGNEILKITQYNTNLGHIILLRLNIERI